MLVCNLGNKKGFAPIVDSGRMIKVRYDYVRVHTHTYTYAQSAGTVEYTDCFSAEG